MTAAPERSAALCAHAVGVCWQPAVRRAVDGRQQGGLGALEGFCPHDHVLRSHRLLVHWYTLPLPRVAPPSRTLAHTMSHTTPAGADIGGFFHDPSTELLTRWYQAGAFQPFARAHAHIDTKRREPWLFGDDVLARVRSAIVRRYTYLPYFYTLFHHASVNGAPVMRPLWYEYPKDEATFAMDDQWLLGSDLLVHSKRSSSSSSSSRKSNGFPTDTRAAGCAWCDRSSP